MGRGAVVNIKLTFEDDKAQAQFIGLRREIADTTHLFNSLAEKVYEFEDDTFKREGNPKWVSLSRKYKLWKDKHYPGRKILELTGSLKAAATGSTGGSMKVLPIRRQSKEALEIGIKGAYVWAHQAGNLKRGLYRRMIYNFTRSNLAEIAGIYDYHAKTAVERIYG